MKNSDEIKQAKSLLENTLRQLAGMVDSYDKVTTNPNIDNLTKDQVSLLYKRYNSTQVVFLEEMKKSEIPEIKEVMDKNKQLIDRLSVDYNKEGVIGVTADTVASDKKLASEQVVSFLTLPKERTALMNQKALIAHHMAAYSTSVSEVANKTLEVVNKDLEYVNKEIKEMSKGKTKQEIKTDKQIQDFEKIKGELEGRVKILGQYKDNKQSIASLTPVQKEELAKLTKEQAFRLKALSTVLKGTNLETVGNDLAVFKGYLEKDTFEEKIVRDAVKSLYGSRAAGFMAELKEYREGTVEGNKKAMKELIGISPEVIGTSAASAISKSPYDINNQFNQKTSSSILPKEYLNQFYASVVFNVSNSVSLDEKYTEWKLLNLKDKLNEIATIKGSTPDKLLLASLSHNLEFVDNFAKNPEVVMVVADRLKKAGFRSEDLPHIVNSIVNALPDKVLNEKSPTPMMVDELSDKVGMAINMSRERQFLVYTTINTDKLGSNIHIAYGDELAKNTGRLVDRITSSESKSGLSSLSATEKRAMCVSILQIIDKSHDKSVCLNSLQSYFKELDGAETKFPKELFTSSQGKAFLHNIGNNPTLSKAIVSEMMANSGEVSMNKFLSNPDSLENAAKITQEVVSKTPKNFRMNNNLANEIAKKVVDDKGQPKLDEKGLKDVEETIKKSNQAQKEFSTLAKETSSKYRKPTTQVQTR